MIKVYSTGCPQCLLLEKLLKDKHVEYEIISDEESLMRLSSPSVPQMDLCDGSPIMLFPEALKYVRGL